MISFMNPKVDFEDLNRFQRISCIKVNFYKKLQNSMIMKSKMFARDFLACLKNYKAPNSKIAGDWGGVNGLKRK